ncbi:MAG TPA: radical SAM protein, partial [Deltaproteobacteria bacterium]|nr:radical SAM protein [Deltaproteobacteria bacterium]
MKKFCLLLASPRFPHHFPRGILEMAGFLEKNGCPTALLPLGYHLGGIDLSQGLSPEQDALVEGLLRDALKETGASVVGISNSFSPDYPVCVKVLELCKRIDGRLVTVIGGPHVTFQDAEALLSPFVDVVVRGEGEWSMFELLCALKKGSDLAAIAGITLRLDGRIVRNPDRELGDLSEIPPIDFDLLPFNLVHTAQIYGISTRGCAYRCRYCVESAFWRKKRNYPVKRLVDEMEVLDRRFGNKVLGFFESMLDADSTQLFQLCDEIVSRGMRLAEQFVFHVRPDSVTQERIAAVRRAGMNWASMGVESASPRVLKMMNRRNLTRDLIIESCRILRAQGVHVHTYWIVGHPGDTREESEDSFAFLRYLIENELCQTAEAMIFQPYPGTCFFDDPQKYGVEILEPDWNRWRRFDSRPVSQLSDFSADDIHAAWRRMDSYLHAWKSLSRLSSIAGDGSVFASGKVTVQEGAAVCDRDLGPA